MKSVLASRFLKLGKSSSLKISPVLKQWLSQSIGLQKYQNDVNKKVINATNVWPSTPIRTDLAAHLVGAVLGYEGEKVFPSVFRPPSYTPSPFIVDSVETAVLQEMNRGNGMDGRTSYFPLKVDFNVDGQTPLHFKNWITPLAKMVSIIWVLLDYRMIF